MKRPLSFGATMLASALGVVIASVVGGILTLIVMISTVVAMSSAVNNDVAPVLPNTVVNLDLGMISGDRTASALEQKFGDNSTVGLIDACRAIRRAANDDRVNALYITDPGATKVSWGSLTELRDAVNDFRESGKPVISYATSYSQGGYYLCSAADMVCLHPSGMVDFRGIGAQVMYYKDMLDKLGVEMQLIRPESCSYKSAGEVYTMNHMSSANREQIRAYIASIWGEVAEQIAASRSVEHFKNIGNERANGMTVSELNQIASTLGGYLATDAEESDLVDWLCFEADVKKSLRNNHDCKKMMSLAKYAASTKASVATTKNKVAVIYAEGNVVDGSARGFSTGVYGDDIVKALRQATEDNNVKAIVLRVNSPGGQATASESMTHAVIEAKEVKPVVVSMGDLAASAGYEMSCMADCIVAQPTTVTGSIGVFGTIPNLDRLMKQKLGISVDTVGTNRNSTAMSIMQPLSPTAKAMMERNVEDFYKVFVNRVAEGRNMTFAEVHKVARGRVWTGKDALQIGLVDTLGGIDVAISIAAQMADIDDNYSIAEYPKEKDTWTQISELLGDNAERDLSLLARLKLALCWKMQATDMPTPVDRLQADMQYIATSEGLQARMPFVIIGE